MEGQGRWFETRRAAHAYTARHLDRGARSFDVGCFQINHRWHGQAFPSLHAMFDPERNARYAARFLARLYREKGNWPDAAAAYHSRTPKYANRYRSRFERISRAVKQHDHPTDAGTEPGGRGPLVTRRAAPSGASLVTADAPRRAPGSLVPRERSRAPFLSVDTRLPSLLP